MTSRRTWVLTGASGMLARDVLLVLGERPTQVFARSDLDITDVSAVARALKFLGTGDVVVNCAAYTDVDAAESDEATAFAVNAVGPENLAKACAFSGAHLVQVSTDYVFRGDATEPYSVDATTAPATAYGRSKAAGERAVRAQLPVRHWIIRTAWLYGEHGASFVRSMAELEASREFVDVVADQHGQPTWTRDLAQQIVATVESDAPVGTYHGASSGRTTWHGLASEVFTLLGADPARVRPITSAALRRPAVRPTFSVLDLGSWAKVGLSPIRDWREALAEAVGSGVLAPRPS